MIGALGRTAAERRSPGRCGRRGAGPKCLSLSRDRQHLRRCRVRIVTGSARKWASCTRRYTARSKRELIRRRSRCWVLNRHSACTQAPTRILLLQAIIPAASSRAKPLTLCTSAPITTSSSSRQIPPPALTMFSIFPAISRTSKTPAIARSLSGRGICDQSLTSSQSPRTAVCRRVARAPECPLCRFSIAFTVVRFVLLLAEGSSGRVIFIRYYYN